jgi:hypothetical protein
LSIGETKNFESFDNARKKREISLFLPQYLQFPTDIPTETTQHNLVNKFTLWQ